MQLVILHHRLNFSFTHNSEMIGERMVSVGAVTFGILWLLLVQANNGVSLNQGPHNLFQLLIIEEIYRQVEICNTTVPNWTGKVMLAYVENLSRVSYHFINKVAEMWMIRAVDYVLKDSHPSTDYGGIQNSNNNNT